MTHKGEEYCVLVWGYMEVFYPDSSCGSEARSSYFPTPNPPGSNPLGTPPTQDPGGPRKPAFPLKNKEGGAEPWNPGPGRHHSRGGEAQTTGSAHQPGACLLYTSDAADDPRVV